MYDRTTVRPYDRTTVRPYDRWTIRPYDRRPYDRTTVGPYDRTTDDRTTEQGATFNSRGQLYRGQVNATAFFGIPVVSALGFESDDPGSIPGCGKALCP